MKRYPVASIADIKERGRKIVKVKGMEVGIFFVDGHFVAYRNFCPHGAAPACEGPICGTRLPTDVYEYEYGRENEILRCPWHGWEFDLKTGRHLVDEKVKLRSYTIEQEGDNLYLLLR